MLAEGDEKTSLTRRSVTRVDWFRREPVGGTIFVGPAGNGGPAHPVTGGAEAAPHE